MKQVGFVDFDFAADFVDEHDDGGEGAAGARGGRRRSELPVAPLPSSSSSSSNSSYSSSCCVSSTSTGGGPSRAAAERLTFYPVLTAKNRPRAWLPKLGLAGGGGGAAAGGGASAARAKTAADVFIEAPLAPDSPPLPSAAVAEC